MSEEGELVQLYVYDLSNGLARQFSPLLLGKQIDGIWHSAIVVGGQEYYFGFGINQAVPGHSPFGRPTHVYDLGMTFIPEDVRDEFLADLSERYTPQAYNLLHNNCNNFSNELAQLLVGQGIPEHITGLPAEVLSTPFGQMMLPMLQGLERQLASVRQEPFHPHHPHPQQQAQQQQQPTGPSSAPAGPAALEPAHAAGEQAGSAAASGSMAPGVRPQATNKEAEGEQSAAPVVPAAEGQGPAVQAAAQHIAAATGLAMVEEAEEQGGPASGTAPGSQPLPAAPSEEPAAAGRAGASAGGGSPPAPPAPERAPRSAAAAAAAAAAERRAQAAAGAQGGSSHEQGDSVGAAAPSAGPVPPEGPGTRAACEEAVRGEFARLMALGELTAETAAAQAARKVAAQRARQEGSGMAEARA